MSTTPISLDVIWPEWFQVGLEWFVRNSIPEIVGIAGFVVSVVGFIVAIAKIRRIKSAAVAAEAAAIETRNSIRFHGSISNVSEAISILDEIRRHHRHKTYEPLPDRYVALRRILISVREQNPDLTDEQRQKLQETMVMLTTLERAMEFARAKGKSPELVRKNHLLSANADQLHTILLDLQTRANGRSR